MPCLDPLYRTKILLPPAVVSTVWWWFTGTPSLRIILCRRELSCPRLCPSLGTACIHWLTWGNKISDFTVGQHWRAILAPQLLVGCAESSAATAERPSYRCCSRQTLLSCSSVCKSLFRIYLTENPKWGWFLFNLHRQTSTKLKTVWQLLSYWDRHWR